MERLTAHVLVCRGPCREPIEGGRCLILHLSGGLGGGEVAEGGGEGFAERPGEEAPVEGA